MSRLTSFERFCAAATLWTLAAWFGRLLGTPHKFPPWTDFALGCGLGIMWVGIMSIWKALRTPAPMIAERDASNV